MTRRRLLTSIAIPFAGQLGCANNSEVVLARILSMQERANVAILDRDLSAFTVPYKGVGQLKLEDYCGIKAISSDGSKVAWVPFAAVDPLNVPNSQGFIRSEAGVELTFRYQGRPG